MDILWYIGMINPKQISQMGSSRQPHGPRPGLKLEIFAAHHLILLSTPQWLVQISNYKSADAFSDRQVASIYTFLLSIWLVFDHAKLSPMAKISPPEARFAQCADRWCLQKDLIPTKKNGMNWRGGPQTSKPFRLQVCRIMLSRSFTIEGIVQRPVSSCFVFYAKVLQERLL